MTPVERRNFASVVLAAKKSKPGPMSFQNIRVMYIKNAWNQKMGLKPPKKGVSFSSEFLVCMKQTVLFLEVLLSLSSQFLLLGSLYVHGTDILKRHRSWLAFFGYKDH